MIVNTCDSYHMQYSTRVMVITCDSYHMQCLTHVIVFTCDTYHMRYLWHVIVIVPNPIHFLDNICCSFHYFEIIKHLTATGHLMILCIYWEELGIDFKTVGCIYMSWGNYICGLKSKWIVKCFLDALASLKPHWLSDSS